MQKYTDVLLKNRTIFDHLTLYRNIYHLHSFTECSKSTENFSNVYVTVKT